MAAAWSNCGWVLLCYDFWMLKLIGQAVFTPPLFASEGIHYAMGTSLELMENQLAADWPYLSRSA